MEKFRKLYKIAFSGILCWLIVGVVFGQDNEFNRGTFSANYTEGCGPLTVTFTGNLSCLPSASNYSYEWKYSNEPNSKFDENEFSNSTTGEYTFEPQIDEDTGEVKQKTEIIVKFAWTSNNREIPCINDPNGATPQEDKIIITLYSLPPPEPIVEYCSGSKVKLTLPNNNYPTNYRFSIDWGDNTTGSILNPSVPNNSREHTYTTGSIQIITYKGYFLSTGPPIAQSNCAEYTVQVIPYNDLPGVNNALLTFPNTTSGEYLFTTTLPKDVIYVISSQPTIDNRLDQPKGTGLEVELPFENFPGDLLDCFYLIPVNNCTNPPTAGVESRAYCGASWTASATEEGILIDYETQLENGDKVTVLVNGVEQTAINSTLTNDKLLIDEVSCGSSYSIELLIKDINDQPIARSQPKAVTYNYSGAQASIQNTSSYWQNSQLLFTPLPLNEGRTIVYQINGEWKRGTGEITTDYSLDKGCFLLDFEDECGNNAANRSEFCPTVLQNSSTEPDKLKLGWNKYVGYAEGEASYILQIKTPDLGEFVDLQSYDPANTNAFTYTTEELTTDDNGTQYRVKITPVNSQLPESYSSVYTFKLVISGYFPTAFSPNGDGNNDTFGIIGKFVTYCELTIYNRWGEPITAKKGKISPDLSGMQSDVVWDGRGVAPGIYGYKAFFTTTDGNTYEKMGTVLLTK